MTPLAVFALVFRASLLSTGGLGNVSSLHADVVRSGLVSEGAFANAIAVGQVSPGPNGLWVVVLGYELAGFAGAMLALVATSLPPLLVIGTSALVRRSRHPGATGLVWGLGLTVAGVTAAVLVRILGNAGAGLGPGATGLAAAIVIAAGAFALAMHGRASVLLILALGAGAGLLLGAR